MRAMVRTWTDMKRFLFCLLITAGLAENRTGTVETTIVYQTTDLRLLLDIQNAQKWVDFWTIAGEPTVAAYHRGIQAHAQAQLDDLYSRL